MCSEVSGDSESGCMHVIYSHMVHKKNHTQTGKTLTLKYI